MAVVAAMAAASRVHEPISLLFAEEGFVFGYGRNIVNVTLVDIRAWDTFGETSVLIVCAMGIASLLFVRDRAGRTDRLRNVLGPVDSSTRAKFAKALDEGPYIARKLPSSDDPEQQQGRNRTWLASILRHGVESRPIILMVGTRLVFYSIITVSLFLLFSGHNQPGGGFASGLLTGIALALRYLAGGRFELGAALPVLPSHLMGGGLLIVTGSALIPVLLGGNPLQTAMFDFTCPVSARCISRRRSSSTSASTSRWWASPWRSCARSAARSTATATGNYQGPDDLVIRPHDDERVAVKERDGRGGANGGTWPVYDAYRGRGGKAGQGGKAGRGRGVRSKRRRGTDEFAGINCVMRGPGGCRGISHS